MAHAMILNPRRKKRKGPRRMSALQRKYFGKRKAKRSRKPTVLIATTNPRRKKRRHHRRHTSHKRHHRRSRKLFSFKRNPRRVRRLRFRRNPLFDTSMLTGMVAPAAIGAGGAILVDLAVGNLPLPPSLVQGPLLPLVRVGAALLLGTAVGEFAGREAGQAAAAGGVTVVIYQLFRQFLATQAPNIQLGRYVGRYVGRKRRALAGGRMHRRGLDMRKGLGRVPLVRAGGVGTTMPLRNMRNVALVQGGASQGGLGYISPTRKLGLGRYMSM